MSSPSTSERPSDSHLLASSGGSFRRRAAWIAAIYGFFATLWIYLSDKALGLLIPNPQSILKWSVYKGEAFVLITSVLLLALMIRAFGKVEDSYLSLVEKDKQLQSSQEQLEAIIRGAMDAIVTVDDKHRITSFNDAAQTMFGCDENTAQNQSISHFISQPFEAIKSGNIVLRGRRLNGEVFPVETSISQVHFDNRRFFTYILRDVSQRQAHEAEIERLNRLYAALSQINQAIVWTETREALLLKVCQVLVEFGGFQMAWISWQDKERERLVPVARSGNQTADLETLLPSTLKSDSTSAAGPIELAFREERPVVYNDIAQESESLPWHTEMQERGLNALACYPIRIKNAVRATLTVHAEEVHFFQDKEKALLEEAALDISFALDTLERREESERLEAIVRSEKIFSDTMIESMPGILYFYDAEGRFLRWNRNFELVSGYSGDEIQKMSPLDFFEGHEKQELESRIGEVFEMGESCVEASFITKNGHAIPYFFTGRRVVWEDHVCLVGVGIDISERKHAELALQKSEERYRSTLDNTLEACQIIGFDWQYLYLNRAATIHNRRPNAELLGKRLLDVWPGIEATGVFKLLKRCMEERIPLHEETEFTFSDGKSGWFDVRTQPVPEGIFVLSIDISERKASELALRELNETLELKVVERTHELQKALGRAEEADRLKSAFLATMSHELRTPLNSIIGFTGIILQELAGPLNAEQKKQLSMVRSSARHLLELINDVLDLSKIEAGQLEVVSESFNLPTSIERVVGLVRPLAEKKGLQLSTSIAPELGPMRSDRRRVEQILINLLSNAIKFTDAGTVRLIAEVLPEFQFAPRAPMSPAVRIRIIDTGMGIKPEHLTTLFQPFRQVDIGLARQHEGTGLGLAICRRLAVLMGGEIIADSEWSKGSEFSVILPLQV